MPRRVTGAMASTCSSTPSVLLRWHSSASQRATCSRFARRWSFSVPRLSWQATITRASFFAPPYHGATDSLPRATAASATVCSTSVCLGTVTTTRQPGRSVARTVRSTATVSRVLPAPVQACITPRSRARIAPITSG